MSEHGPKMLPPQEGPDIYNDPTEVLWKFVSLDAYDSVIQKLNEAGLLSDLEVQKLHVTVIDLFNSNHNQKIFCGRTQIILNRLRDQLTAMGRIEVYDAIDSDVKNAGRQITSMLQRLDEQGLSHISKEQTHIEDGLIQIAGMSIEEFSAQPDYLSATLQLFDERDGTYRDAAEQVFLKGFELDEKERKIIHDAKELGTEMVDLITLQLLHQQTTMKYGSISEYEYLPLGNLEENKERKKKAMSEAYFFIGKIMRTVADFCKEDENNAENIDTLSIDPVERFLQAAGKTPAPEQVAAVKKIALAHISHGLNSGELTARLAGSVRTSFPRALIASFNIRSGILHSGAVSECMKQTGKYLESSMEPDEYVASILKSGKPYGFGHRIHKTDTRDSPEVLGKDPRVSLYIEACRKGFPEKKEQIDRLVAYAKAVRRARPSLGANTDFGASVLFHALDLSANTAVGFFAAFRSPGVCAQVVNELNVKGNSRRPPFPPVLPYPKK
ncbi:MAG: citrate/2-methylcitrate synthase [Candidatus Paceibacterota bacterium]|jgi:citrate synthase